MGGYTTLGKKMRKGVCHVDIVLRPELRTDGGEMLSIFHGEEWVGDAFLVYREGDALTASIQVDSTSVSQEDYQRIVQQAGLYVEDLVQALRVEDATVMSLCGDIRTVLDVSTDFEPAYPNDTDLAWSTDTDNSADHPDDDLYTLEMRRDGSLRIERRTQ